MHVINKYIFIYTLHSYTSVTLPCVVGVILVVFSIIVETSGPFSLDTLVNNAIRVQRYTYALLVIYHELWC